MKIITKTLIQFFTEKECIEYSIKNKWFAIKSKFYDHIVFYAEKGKPQLGKYEQIVYLP